MKSHNTPSNAAILGAKEISTSMPGIGSKISNALLSVFRAILIFCAKICLRILKEIGKCLLAVVGFVAGVIVEAAIDLRWLLLASLAVMALALLWKQSMHRSHQARLYELLHPPVQIAR